MKSPPCRTPDTKVPSAEGGAARGEAQTEGLVQVVRMIFR